MKYNNYNPGKVNPHLPHDAVEMAPPPSNDFEDAERLITELLRGTKNRMTPEMEARLAKELAPEPAAMDRDDVDVGVEDAVSDMVAESDPAEPTPQTRSDDRPIEMCDDETVQSVLKQIFPPLQEQEAEEETPRRSYKTLSLCLGAAGFTALFMLWPLHVLGWTLLGVTVLVVTILALKLRFVAWPLGYLWRRYAAKAPERAERIRRMADGVAFQLEKVLDVLPGGLADHLALPDFSQPVTPNR